MTLEMGNGPTNRGANFLDSTLRGGSRVDNQTCYPRVLQDAEMQCWLVHCWQQLEERRRVDRTCIQVRWHRWMNAWIERTLASHSVMRGWGRWDSTESSPFLGSCIQPDHLMEGGNQITRWQTDGGPQQTAKLRPKVRSKLWPPVRDHVTGETMQPEHMVQHDYSSFFCSG